jgi:hypothetical protein
MHAHTSKEWLRMAMYHFVIVTLSLSLSVHLTRNRQIRAAHRWTTTQASHDCITCFSTRLHVHQYVCSDVQIGACLCMWATLRDRWTVHSTSRSASSSRPNWKIIIPHGPITYSTRTCPLLIGESRRTKLEGQPIVREHEIIVQSSAMM